MPKTDYKDIISLARVLTSKNCLMILEYLATQDASNQDLYKTLGKDLDLTRRTSVFEVLKRMKKVGLVEKYYEDETNKIMYRLKVKQIQLDLEKMEIIKY